MYTTVHSAARARRLVLDEKSVASLTLRAVGSQLPRTHASQVGKCLCAAASFIGSLGRRQGSSTS
jgi:hypothetical protein